MSDEKSMKRRQFVKRTGLGLATLTTVGSAQAKQTTTTGGETTDDEPTVSPESMDHIETHWIPTSAAPYEDVTLQSRWHLNGSDYYQLDVLVEADIAQKPTISSHNLHGITKRFEYRSDSPVGPAYHFQAKDWFYGTDQDRYLDSTVTPTGTGSLTAKTGTFWPWQWWATASLTVE